MARPVILGVFAHPDDETFHMGGVTCRYAAAGYDVALISATRGEAGKAGDPPVCTRAELPAAELRRAAAILGVAEVIFLDYPDKGVEHADPIEAAGKLVREIRRLRPVAVITWELSGGYGHPDHIAVGRLTRAAVAAAAAADAYPALGPAHRVRRLLETVRPGPWEMAENPELLRQHRVDVVVDVSAYVERKVEALRAHRTQHLSIGPFMLDHPNRAARLKWETFNLVGEPPPGAPLGDILAGL